MVLSYLVRPGIPHTDPGESHRSNRLRIPGKRSLRRSLTFFHSLECHRVEFNQDNRGGAGGDGEKDVFDVHIESIANGGNVVNNYSEITSSPKTRASPETLALPKTRASPETMALPETQASPET